MAIVQDTYNATPAKGYPGMVANGETSNRISRTCEDAAGIAFGRACYRGTGDHGTTATPAVGTLLGFAIADHGIVPLPGGVAADIYPQYGTVGIMNAGVIHVTAGSDVTDGAQVYVTPAGLIVDDAGGNVIADGWFFDETVASGGIVRIARR
jgi:hypothetical protein